MPVDLAVPFVEKDEAKALGARWEPTRRVWYVPDGCTTHLERFERWLPTIADIKPADPGPKPGKSKIVDTRVDSHPPVRTSPKVLKEGCACDVLPWDHCEHTR